VGCATGDFIAFARERGWDVAGVELTDSAAAFCRDQLGLPVVTGDLLAAGYPSDTFDVVTMWNVFEHLYDPVATLREIRRILRPTGLLVLAVPELDSLDARIFGPAWKGYDVPRHLHTFSRATLKRMLAEGGFRISQRRCLESSHFVFFQSLQFWLDRRAGWTWAIPWAKRLEHWRLVRLFTAPYFRLTDSLVKGPVVTTFARLEDSA
jgi:SAM-dependent methyltransferase